MNNAERKFLQEWNAEQRKREADLNQQKPKTPADRQALDEQRQRLVARRGDGADLARKYAEYRQPSATITLYTDNAELKNVPRQSTLRVRSTIESCTHQVHFRTPNLGRAANIAMNYVGSERGLAEFQRSGAKLGENELVVIKFSLKGTLVEVLPEEQTTKASSTK